MTYRYFVSQECSCFDSPQEHEVSKADYVSAERKAGFRNTMNQPNEPATASFGSTKDGVTISGRVEFVHLLACDFPQGPYPIRHTR